MSGFLYPVFRLLGLVERQVYMCPEEREGDEALKEELFQHTSPHSGFGRQIAQLQRPLTVRETVEIFDVLRDSESARQSTLKKQVP